MKRRLLGVLLGLAVWGAAFSTEAAFVTSGSGTMRFQWVDLRDSGGASLTTLPTGFTAIGDAVAFGWADNGSYSANYWKNGVLSNDVWVKVPLALGDLYEAELSVSGQLELGPGWVDVYCATWSTFYFHNQTTETFTAEFSVDYTATLSSVDPQKFTDFDVISSQLSIGDFGQHPALLDYDDRLSADGVATYNRSLQLFVLMEPGWTTVDVNRSTWIYVESSIPEPSTFCMAGMAAVGLLWARRRSWDPKSNRGGMNCAGS